MNMDVSDEFILEFLDLIDLDETVVDTRIHSLTTKTYFSNSNLRCLIYLFQYKLLTNQKENMGCDNDEEFSIVPKLLHSLDSSNIENICKVIVLILKLDPDSLCSKAEHLVQQLLLDIYEEISIKNKLLVFKVVNCIIKCVSENNDKVSLLFLEVKLENTIYDEDEQVRKYFVMNIVPSFVEGVVGYNILRKIWISFTKDCKCKDQALYVLSCLSEYFIPVSIDRNIAECCVVQEPLFWELILYGLETNSTLRKISIYLMKKSIDAYVAYKYSLSIESVDRARIIFSWIRENADTNKETWDKYFVLLESLEEKQSNIVLASLQLFDSIKEIPSHWLRCVFMLGLTHDNLSVRRKCIDYRVRYVIETLSEAHILLDALNDSYLYDTTDVLNTLKPYFSERDTFKYVFNMLPKTKWSPVPFYHITTVLCNVKIDNIFTVIKEEELMNIVLALLEIPCNNIVIRHEVQHNLLMFISQFSGEITWESFLKICSKVHKDVLKEVKTHKVLQDSMKMLKISDKDRLKFFEYTTSSHTHIDVALIHLSVDINELSDYIKLVNHKLTSIQNICSRQYSKKIECFDDFVYVTIFFNKCLESDQQFEYFILNASKDCDVLLQYAECCLSSEIDLNMKQLELFWICCRHLLHICTNKDTLLRLYQSAVILLNEQSGSLTQKMLSMIILENLTRNYSMLSNCRHEMLDIESLLNLTMISTSNIIKTNDTGRILNKIYELSCETLHSLIKFKNEHTQVEMVSIFQFLDRNMECGGYGCIKWILKIIDILLPDLIEKDIRIFDIWILKIIDTSWTEILNLKSNSQYSPCMKEFIYVITNKALVRNRNYTEVMKKFISSIIHNDCGTVSSTTLFYLFKRMKNIKFNLEFPPLISAICEVLLFCPVIRRDQRITDDLVKSLQDNMSVDKSYHFNYELQNMGVSLLLSVEQDVLQLILDNFMKMIDAQFKTKQRYHENSQRHKLILTGMQHILFITLLQSKFINMENIAAWCVDLLVRLPHQASVKFFTEWCIALYLCYQRKELKEEMLQKINFKTMPVPSQLMVLYMHTVYKADNDISCGEYEFVMDYFLSFTMGQTFNIRLIAQYLSIKLYNLCNQFNFMPKYDYTMKLIEKTLESGSQEKAYIRLQKDFFVNNFDIIKYLKPDFIYHYAPKLFGLRNGEVAGMPTTDQCKEYIHKHGCTKFISQCWMNRVLGDDEIDDFIKHYEQNDLSAIEDNNVDISSTIQKKYIPWRNMSDIDVVNLEKKRENTSNLIVVASLIDKLPNLGGMARTSEVFGVNTYVVDSLRHLQDRQFQGLSVSAEKWVNIEEVRPGKPLKEYLIRKKDEGYSLVAAEQTSSSVSLKEFKFPVKSLLLLGHEKEGVPCDLLPLMDHCVEIPQQGYVRSLNVHVTAAIFVWEYVRQNVLN